MVLTGSTCCLVELAEGGSENEEGRAERVEQTDRGWLSKGIKGQQHRRTSFGLIMCAERECTSYRCHIHVFNRILYFFTSSLFFLHYF